MLGILARVRNVQIGNPRGWLLVKGESSPRGTGKWRRSLHLLHRGVPRLVIPLGRLHAQPPTFHYAAGSPGSPTFRDQMRAFLDSCSKPPPPPPPPKGLLRFGEVRFGTTFARYAAAPPTDINRKKD